MYPDGWSKERREKHARVTRAGTASISEADAGVSIEQTM